MKNRREFLKIFGMLTAASAALTIVGTVAQPALLGAVDTETCVKTPTKIKAYHGPKKDIYDLESKWLAGDFEAWRKVWAGLANAKAVQLTPNLQERMVNNVFQKSPMFEYLKNKDTMVVNPDTIISTGDIDISHFGPQAFDTYTTSGTTTGGTGGLVVGSNLETNTNE